MKILKIIFISIIVFFVARLIIKIYFKNEQAGVQKEINEKNDKTLAASTFYDIDSLIRALVLDKKYNIQGCTFEKKDSTLNIMVDPSFDVNDRNKNKEYFLQLCTNHKLAYAKNIALFSFVKVLTFNADGSGNVKVLFDFSKFDFSY